MESNCSICTGNISKKVIEYNNFGINKYDGLFDSLSLCFCIECGFGSIDTKINPDLIWNFYKLQYRSKNSAFYINFDSKNDIHETFVDYSHKTTQQIILIKDYCDFNKGENFLDIGPGAGGSFYIAQKLLDNPNLFGIEITEGASEFYNQFPLSKINIFGSIEDFISTKKTAKVILMSHSLEHYQADELPKLFQDIEKALDPSGLLIIEVPNVDLRIHEKVRGTDTPHFLFFSQNSICTLLEKYGFQILFNNTCDDFYESEYDIKNQNNKLKFKFKLKKNLRPIFNKLPMFIQIQFRRLKKLKHYFIANNKSSLSSDNQEEIVSIYTNRKHKVITRKIDDNLVYGGNRKCIRVVAKISKKN
jgi:SAM-dependent methyltransferase